MLPRDTVIDDRQSNHIMACNYQPFDCPVSPPPWNRRSFLIVVAALELCEEIDGTG